MTDLAKDSNLSEFTCIVCPIGCTLTVVKAEDGCLTVTGNRCPKGEVYAREETLSPKRVVTAVVRTDSRSWPCIPVRTDAALPRPLVPDLIRDLAGLSVALPAARGTMLIENYRGSGVNVILTRTLPPSSPPTPAPLPPLLR
jgi:CxxC motif-containing protein